MKYSFPTLNNFNNNNNKNDNNNNNNIFNNKFIGNDINKKELNKDLQNNFSEYNEIIKDLSYKNYEVTLGDNNNNNNRSQEIDMNMVNLNKNIFNYQQNEQKNINNPINNNNNNNNNNYLINSGNFYQGQKFIGDNYTSSKNQKTTKEEIENNQNKKYNEDNYSLINEENQKIEENLNYENKIPKDNCFSDRPTLSANTQKPLDFKNLNELDDNLVQSNNSQTLTLEDKINGLKQKISNFESKMNMIPQEQNYQR